MKRYLLYILASGATLAFLSSCSVKEDDHNQGADNGFTLFYGRAYNKDATKISIGDPYTVSEVTYYKGLWESGDQISVYRVSDGECLGNASLEEGVGAQEGTFIMPGNTGGADVRIIYPSGANYNGVHTLPFDQEQEDAGTNTFNEYCFAYSGIKDGNHFSLTHVPSYVKVIIQAESSDEWYDAEVTAVTLKAPGAALSGDFTVDYDSGNITPGKNVYDYVTVTLTNTIAIEEDPQEVWLAVLPSDLSGSLVTVTLSLEKDAVETETVVKFTGKPLLANSVNTLRISNLKSIIVPGDESSVNETIDVEAHSNKSNEYSNYSTMTLSGMHNMDRFIVDTRDRWGGYAGVKPDHITSTNSEGFWRTGTYHGRPMFVNPDGNVSFLNGVNAVTPDPLSDAADSHTTNYYNSKFGTEYEWAAWCADNIANYGFNFFNTNPKRFRNYRMNHEIGMGITPDIQERLHAGNNKKLLSQTENLYFLRTFLWDYYSLTKKTFASNAKSPFILMFDPGWQDYINKLALFAAQFFKDDPNFIGYYTDNELPFCETTDTGKPIEMNDFLTLTVDTGDAYYYRCNPYAKAWALQWMQDNYGTTVYSSSMEKPFLRAVAEYYFRTTAEAIRAADPQHMVMGSRIHKNSKETQEIIESCARYHDVITINFYDYWDISSFSVPLASIRNWAGGKPVMITEFYVKNANQTAPDSTPYNNTEGAGWWVKSQKARGQFYQNNVIRFIQDGTIAGWQWFKWTDDYRYTVPGWINKGLVVPDYRGTYTDCTSLMKSMHWNLYQCLDYYWGEPVDRDFTEGAGDIPEGIWE